MRIPFTGRDRRKLLATHNINQMFARAFSFLLFIFLYATAFAQSNTRISGRVTDEGGVPLPGASIIVKGASNGVNSNDNGTFEIFFRIKIN